MTAPTAEAEVNGNGAAEEEAEGSGLTGTLTIEAPDGAEFEPEEVKTARGTKSLGEVPILVWKDVDKAKDFYGEEGLVNILDGTSLRVSFQSIGRRHALAGKSWDECAQAVINFRPGKRAAGVSTPVSRAGNAARKAAEKLGDKADSVTKLLERIAKGEVSEEELARLSGE